MEDDIYNLITWIWNAKDYLRKRSKEITGNADLVHNAINSDHHLNTLGDLANGLKHGTFKKLALGKMSSTFPQDAITTIILGEPNLVEMDVANANLVEFRLPIIDSNSKEIGDAFDYAERAMSALENIRAMIDKSNQ